QPGDSTPWDGSQGQDQWRHGQNPGAFEQDGLPAGPPGTVHASTDSVTVQSSDPGNGAAFEGARPLGQIHRHCRHAQVATPHLRCNQERQALQSTLAGATSIEHRLDSHPGHRMNTPSLPLNPLRNAAVGRAGPRSSSPDGVAAKKTSGFSRPYLRLAACRSATVSAGPVAAMSSNPARPLSTGPIPTCAPPYRRLQIYSACRQAARELDELPLIEHPHARLVHIAAAGALPTAALRLTACRSATVSAGPVAAMSSNPARPLSTGPVHTCEPRFVLVEFSGGHASEIRPS